MADEAKINNVEPEKVNLVPKMPEIQSISSDKISPPIQSVSTEMPIQSAPAQEAKPEDNAFTKLFGDDKIMQSADLIGSVNSQSEMKGKSFIEKLKSLKNLRKEKQETAKSPAGKIMLKVSIAVFVLIFAFFYTQNSANFNWFGVNTAQKLVLAEEELTKTKAEVTVQKHLSTIILLDQFTNLADSYLYNLEQSESDSNSSNRREVFAQSADEDFEEIQNLLLKIQSNIDKEIDSNLKVKSSTLISDLNTALKEKSGEVDEASLSQDVQDLQNTRTLIQEDSFRSLLADLDIDTVDSSLVSEILSTYNELNQSTYGTITSIKNTKRNWQTYFDELEKVTKTVDPLFNTEFTANIKITSVRYEASTIRISGETSTEDTKNFTLVSNYIDELEKSALFKNVADRSFSKNSSESNYTGQFRISLELEQ